MTDRVLHVGMEFTHKTMPGVYRVTSYALGNVYFRRVVDGDTPGRSWTVTFDEFTEEHFRDVA